MDEMFKWCIAGLGFAISVLCFVRWQQTPKGVFGRWVHLAFSIVGLYWAGLYIVVATILPDIVRDPIQFGTNWVRRAILVTLALMVSKAIIELKIHRHLKDRHADERFNQEFS